MKTTIMILMIVGILNGAYIDVKQNMKALYKGIELTEIQEDYILDNQDDNIDILEKALKKEIKNLKLKYIDEKNVISFVLTPTGEVNKIKFLKTSDNRKLDRMTKKIINKVSNKFAKPQEPTIMRYIISYRVGQNQNQQNTNYSNQPQSRTNNEPYYKSISRGTTKFKYQSEEYTRIFETSKDGFINMTQNPHSCAKRVSILTENGQKIAEATGSIFSAINKEAPKGKYKILVQTKKDCNINLEYQ